MYTSTSTHVATALQWLQSHVVSTLQSSMSACVCTSSHILGPHTRTVTHVHAHTHTYTHTAPHRYIRSFVHGLAPFFRLWPEAVQFGLSRFLHTEILVERENVLTRGSAPTKLFFIMSGKVCVGACTACVPSCVRDCV